MQISNTVVDIIEFDISAISAHLVIHLFGGNGHNGKHLLIGLH
jgi:hypothetical protein